MLPILLFALGQNLIDKVNPAYVCERVEIDGCDFPPKNWEHQKFLSVMGWGTDRVLEFPVPETERNDSPQTLLLTNLGCRFYPEGFVIQNITLAVSLVRQGEITPRKLYEFFCSEQYGNESLTQKIPLDIGTVVVEAKFGTPPSLLSAIVAKGIYLVKG